MTGATMFETPRNLVFIDEFPSRDTPNEPSASRGIYSRSDDVEKQARSPYSLPLAGSTNVSIADTLNEEESNLPLSKRSRVGKYFLSDINRNWTEIILILCGFVSGLVDGLSFTFWSSFSSMQTGNIINLALGVSGNLHHQDKLWVKALIAVGAFLLGTFCFIAGSWMLGPLRRLTMILSFSIQTILIMIAAVLAHTEAIGKTPNQDPMRWLQNVAIGLLAFQAAGQIMVSKFLGFPEIITVALSAVMCDIFLDKKLFHGWRENPKRNRKMGFVLALFLGAMTGGGMASRHGLAAGLWLAMAMKGAITVAWFFWPECPPESPPEEGKGKEVK